ncbi:hypothetical protein P3X46_013124 [Hevea brasiliensis]|uniref:Anthocyanin 5-aromatic acyltransferase n=1 Tax=Hevea brasiliensis TaxID=3981 RepID=A0ABQ9M6F4_HEVBR|nr:hypothetical protein P3X46_013124 [Hevea brasiliensis]
MAKSSILKVHEHCKVSPPPNSAPPTTLPLTFLDITWLFFSPSQPLFFYEYLHSTSHFLCSTLPNLKHFFTFLGNLVLSPNDSNKPKIVYNAGDCVSFSVAESSGDFGHLTSNHAREVHEFYFLVPETFNNFIKAWASPGANSCFLINSLPCFDRPVIKDARGLEEIFLKELWKRRSSQEMVVGTEAHVDLSNMVRATFVVSSLDMETIKKWIIMKAQTPMGRFENYDSDEDLNYFGFIAGGLTRLDPVPISYFGNCVGFDRSIAIRRELRGEDGMIVAANMIGNMIKKLDKEILSGAERWISDWKILFELEIHILIFGSPKINLYETDFGWGRPKKIEDITIDNSRAVSLTERRETKGGIEVGLAPPKSEMEVFSSLFIEGLKILQ